MYICIPRRRRVKKNTREFCKADENEKEAANILKLIGVLSKYAHTHIVNGLSQRKSPIKWMINPYLCHSRSHFLPEIYVSLHISDNIEHNSAEGFYILLIFDEFTFGCQVSKRWITSNHFRLWLITQLIHAEFLAEMKKNHSLKLISVFLAHIKNAEKKLVRI